ncbi:hypothetical protein D3C75_1154290 [compost metagenome]
MNKGECPLGNLPFRRTTVCVRCYQAFAKWQPAIIRGTAVDFSIDAGIELRLVAVAQIQAHRLRLAKAGGQVELTITLLLRQRFQLLQYPLCQALAA